MLLFITFYLLQSRLHFLPSSFTTSSHDLPALRSDSLSGCNIIPSSLSGFDISSPFSYNRRYIRTVQNDAHEKHASVQHIDADLLTKFVTIDNTASESKITLSNCSPIQLHVSSFDTRPVDGSELLVGVATTLKRLQEAVPHISQWASHTKLKLVISMEHDAAEARMVESELQNLYHLNIHIKITTGSWEDRYLGLVTLLNNERTPATRWIVLADDDTYFPSLQRLKTMLSAYDPNDPVYIGGLSESFLVFTRYKQVGMGGAGVFLSVTLVDELLSSWDQCLEIVKQQVRTPWKYGTDALIGRCITELTPTKLSIAPHLHQLDLLAHGRSQIADASGFYESGRDIVSLHHWRSWHRADVVGIHRVKTICGDACPLQRWQFRDNVILTNGFSVVQYPHLVPDLSKMEMTFFTEGAMADNPQGGNDKKGTWSEVGHSLTPTRPELIEGKDKKSYKLLDSKEYRDGVRQLYVNRGGQVDQVLDIIWLR
ncbi:hypothetical protein MMC09_002939 [Bachmanniomyces sp. S44760]|nr:hypothetical protein [Bachmanniomyces sp. S44760]